MAANSDDVRAALEQQIAELKKEVARVGKSVSARASSTLEDAEDAYEEGKGRARQFALQARDQAYAAGEVMRENPATTATILSTVGLLGLAAGLVIGGTFYGRGR